MKSDVKFTRRKSDGSYHAVMRIPKNLRADFGGKTHLQQSLKTHSAFEAETKKHRVLSAWQDEFDRRREGTTPTEAQIQQQTHNHYGDFIHDNDALRSSPREVERLSVAGHTVNLVQPNIGFAERAARIKINALLEQLHDPENSPSAYFVDELILREGWVIQKGTREYVDLCNRVIRAEIAAARNIAARGEGDFSDTVNDPNVQAPLVEELPARDGEQITNLFEDYLAETKFDRSTVAAYRQAVSWFSSFVGQKTVPRRAFTRTNARDFKRLLMLAPKRMSGVKEFNGLGFVDSIKANERIGKPVISAKRANLILSGLSSFANWLAPHDYIEDNPFAGLLRKNVEGSTKRHPFNIEEIKLLLASPVFVGAQSDKLIHRPGDVLVDDHRRWMWLLGLFTGARLGELAMLTPADVRDASGATVVNMPTEKRRADARDMARPVPLHPELQRLGFLDYVKRMEGREKLFPDIEASASGDATGELSRELNRYLRRIGLKTETRSITFHSLRHTFIDAARRADLDEYQIQLLVGHSPTSMTRRYGEEIDGTISKRAEWVSRIQYPEVKFETLYIKNVDKNEL